MCSNYEGDLEYVIERFGLTKPAWLDRVNKSVRPNAPALVLATDMEPLCRTWGFQAEWSKGPLFNAKSEELEKKRTWSPWVNSRCLIPATAWFEGSKAKGNKSRIEVEGGQVFCIAGIMTEDWFTMLTCAPNEQMKAIHHRMPCVLEEDSWADWINPDADYEDVKPVLKPWNGSPKVEAL